MRMEYMACAFLLWDAGLIQFSSNFAYGPRLIWAKDSADSLYFNFIGPWRELVYFSGHVSHGSPLSPALSHKWEREQASATCSPRPLSEHICLCPLSHLWERVRERELFPARAPSPAPAGHPQVGEGARASGVAQSSCKRMKISA
jgi:hypothetical protein